MAAQYPGKWNVAYEITAKITFHVLGYKQPNGYKVVSWKCKSPALIFHIKINLYISPKLTNIWSTTEVGKICKNM